MTTRTGLLRAVCTEYVLITRVDTVSIERSCESSYSVN